MDYNLLKVIRDTNANTVTISFMLFFLATNGMLFSSATISAYNLGIIFPQTKDLYPLVYFMSTFFIIYILCRGDSSSVNLIIYVIIAIVHAFFIYYLWAHGALLGATVGMALIIVFESREMANMAKRRAALGRFMLIYTIVVGAVSSVLFFTAVGVLGERYSDSSILQQSDSTRLELAFGALECIADSPVFGHMFIPE